MDENMKKALDEARDALMNSAKPLIFFDDDPDGLLSFVLLYRLVREGSGIIVNSSPEVTPDYLRRVEDFGPDVVFIVDKPLVSQEFLDGVKCPVYWIDHHGSQKRHGVKYINPKDFGELSRPTTYWAYQISQKKEDLWIAMTGMTADWYYCEEYVKEFREKFPDLLPEEKIKPEEALFNTRLGELAKIIAFNLKGPLSDVNKSKKIITRINSPYEILDQTSPQGKWIYKRFKKVNESYEDLLGQLNVTEDKILCHIYKEDKYSITREMSNEVLYKHPDKIIIVGREHDGFVKISLRSATISIDKVLAKALEGLNGTGGGHEFACGAKIPVEQWDEFMRRVKELVE